MSAPNLRVTGTAAEAPPSVLMACVVLKAESLYKRDYFRTLDRTEG